MEQCPEIAGRRLETSINTTPDPHPLIQRMHFGDWVMPGHPRLYRRLKDDDVSPLDTCDMHRDCMITVVTHRAPRIAFVGLGALEPIMVDRSARFLEAGNRSEFCLAQF